MSEAPFYAGARSISAATLAAHYRFLSPHLPVAAECAYTRSRAASTPPVLLRFLTWHCGGSNAEMHAMIYGNSGNGGSSGSGSGNGANLGSAGAGGPAANAPAPPAGSKSVFAHHRALASMLAPYPAEDDVLVRNRLTHALLQYWLMDVSPHFDLIALQGLDERVAAQLRAQLPGGFQAHLYERVGIVINTHRLHFIRIASAHAVDEAGAGAEALLVLELEDVAQRVPVHVLVVEASEHGAPAMLVRVRAELRRVSAALRSDAAGSAPGTRVQRAQQVAAATVLVGRTPQPLPTAFPRAPPVASVAPGGLVVVCGSLGCRPVHAARFLVLPTAADSDAAAGGTETRTDAAADAGAGADADAEQQLMRCASGAYPSTVSASGCAVCHDHIWVAAVGASEHVSSAPRRAEARHLVESLQCAEVVPPTPVPERDTDMCSAAATRAALQRAS